MTFRLLPLVAALFLLAACDNDSETTRRDEPPVAPKVGSGDGSAGDEKLVTGPKGSSESLPAVPGGTTASDSGRDSAATQPKSELSKQEEKSQMPIAGQANTHSSEALSDDKAAGESSTAGAAPTDDKTRTAQAGAAAGAAAGSAGGGAPATSTPAAAGMSGLELAKKHNCVSCHAVDKKLIGPAYTEVAAKYKGDPAAAQKLVEKVKAGGSGVWGPVPMPPHPNVPDDQIKVMVDWVLAGAN